MNESESDSVFDSNEDVSYYENSSSDDSYIVGALVEKGNDGVDPLDTLDNALFEGQLFSMWCDFTPAMKFYSDNVPSVISPMVFAVDKTVKLEISKLETSLASHVDSCERMYWIMRNCFNLEKMIVHDTKTCRSVDSGLFGLQKLFSLWEKPYKLRCEKLDKFEIHFKNYRDQIEDKDYFISFLASNVTTVKEMLLIGSNFGDQSALEFSKKIFSREPVEESTLYLEDDKITDVGLKAILHSPWTKKCKHINLKIVPTSPMIQVMIDFFLDPKRELEVASFSLAPHPETHKDYLTMHAHYHTGLTTALHFHPTIKEFKISKIDVIYIEGMDSMINFRDERKRKFCLINSEK